MAQFNLSRSTFCWVCGLLGSLAALSIIGVFKHRPLPLYAQHNVTAIVSSARG